MERDARDRRREEIVRINKRQDGDRHPHRSRELAMDQEKKPRKEEDMRIIVRRELTPEPEKNEREKLVNRLEDEDAELLEMRRKALESLMKRTDKDIIERKKSRKASESSSSNSEDSSEESDMDDLDTTMEVDDNAHIKKPEPTFIVTMNGFVIKGYYKICNP